MKRISILILVCIALAWNMNLQAQGMINFSGFEIISDDCWDNSLGKGIWGFGILQQKYDYQGDAIQDGDVWFFGFAENVDDSLYYKKIPFYYNAAQMRNIPWQKINKPLNNGTVNSINVVQSPNGKIWIVVYAFPEQCKVKLLCGTLVYGGIVWSDWVDVSSTVMVPGDVTADIEICSDNDILIVYGIGSSQRIKYKKFSQDIENITSIISLVEYDFGFNTPGTTVQGVGIKQLSSGKYFLMYQSGINSANINAYSRIALSLGDIASADENIIVNSINGGAWWAG